MKEFDELDPEERDIALKAQELREVNSKMAGALEQVGVTFEVGPARLEHFMAKMVDAGLLTDGQMWAIHLDWEEGLNTQLKKAHATVRDRILAEEAMQQRKASTKPTRLVTPRKPGKLIVPGKD